MAKAAAQPSDVLAYWILKHLEEPVLKPVAVPCTHVELDINSLTAAASEPRFAVVAAALQAVHSRNHAPHAKVQIPSISASQQRIRIVAG